MAAPIVYRWDDGNAPVLAGALGYTLVQLLKACLVDGYGSKAAAGWTMPYDDGTVNPRIGVFRNNPVTGTGRYLQVNSTALATSIVQGYEDMTDHITGVNKFSNTTLYSMESTAANTTARPWVLIADDRFFILTVWPNVTAGSFNPAANCVSSTTNSIKALFFGDGIPIRGDDTNFCMLGAETSTYYYWSRNLYFGNHTSTTNVHNGVSRNSLGTYGPFQPQIANTGPCAGTDHGGVSQGFTLATYGYMFARPYVNEGAAYTMRGYLPGLWFPCNTPTVFPYLSEVTYGGRTFLIFGGMQGSAQYVQSWAVEITTGWRE
ncbi:MAG: hypothetical protein VR65_10850 [Desulfobulbaceae bacterium BRH_c16a]|nr:MAG: hypothetical protein VR65_10850 [Desulfobulbaceae bacterium BRH_c16a]